MYLNLLDSSTGSESKTNYIQTRLKQNVSRTTGAYKTKEWRTFAETSKINSRTRSENEIVRQKKKITLRKPGFINNHSALYLSYKDTSFRSINVKPEYHFSAVRYVISSHTNAESEKMKSLE